MPRVIDKENRRLSHAHNVRLSDDEEAAFAAFLAAHDMTAQDCIRGLINRKLWIPNDGLAAKVGNMRGGKDKAMGQIELKALRPRLTHEHGDGYVLSVTVRDIFNPYQLAELLKDLQKGYIKVTLEKA